MKHLGRAFATIGVVAGAVLIAYFTKDGCVPAAMLILALMYIWTSA